MRIVLIALVFALTLYALLGCVYTSDESISVRVPRYLWITLVVLFPTIDPITWTIFSRVKAAEERGSCVEPIVRSSKKGTAFRRLQHPRPMASNDGPEFPRGLEQDIRRRKYHLQEYTGAPNTSNDGVDGGPEASETGGINRSGTDSH